LATFASILCVKLSLEEMPAAEAGNVEIEDSRVEPERSGGDGRDSLLTDDAVERWNFDVTATILH
jgi:uncharacterized protein YrzB (UPF0473 family)